MKVWHLYKEYYLLKTEQGNLEQKLDYMTLFSTNEDGTYDDKDRHIDIVYGRFTSDIIDRIKDNIHFEFAYDIDKITDVLNEKNLIKKINMIKDISEEATTQKIIYKLEENIAKEEGVLEIHYGSDYSSIFIQTTKIKCFEGNYIDKKSPNEINIYFYSQSKKYINFTTLNLKLYYNDLLSFFNCYNNFIAMYGGLPHKDKLSHEVIVKHLLNISVALLKFKKMTYKYMSEITEFAVEKNLQNVINNLACFVRDYCSESDISIAKLSNSQKEIIKLSIRIEKSNSSLTSTKDNEIKLKKILEKKAKSIKDEDIINSFARAS